MGSKLGGPKMFYSDCLQSIIGLPVREKIMILGQIRTGYPHLKISLTKGSTKIAIKYNTTSTIKINDAYLIKA